MISIKIIDVIGYFGSGKTNLIMNGIKLFKKHLHFNVVVVKNVKHHQVDNEGKDSYKFSEVGTTYSVIQNVNREIAIFSKFNDINFEEFINWLQKGPYKIDICLTEGFRNLNNPTILCVSKFDEIEQQITENVKMISGIICLTNCIIDSFSNIPILDIEKDFQKFLEIFNIK